MFVGCSCTGRLVGFEFYLPVGDCFLHFVEVYSYYMCVL